MIVIWKLNQRAVVNSDSDSIMYADFLSLFMWLNAGRSSFCLNRMTTTYGHYYIGSDISGRHERFDSLNVGPL